MDDKLIISNLIQYQILSEKQNKLLFKKFISEDVVDFELIDMLMLYQKLDKDIINSIISKKLYVLEWGADLLEQKLTGAQIEMLIKQLKKIIIEWIKAFEVDYETYAVYLEDEANSANDMLVMIYNEYSNHSQKLNLDNFWGKYNIMGTG